MNFSLSWESSASCFHCTSLSHDSVWSPFLIAPLWQLWGVKNFSNWTTVSNKFILGTLLKSLFQSLTFLERVVSAKCSALSSQAANLAWQSCFHFANGKPGAPNGASRSKLQNGDEILEIQYKGLSGIMWMVCSCLCMAPGLDHSWQVWWISILFLSPISIPSLELFHSLKTSIEIFINGICIDKMESNYWHVLFFKKKQIYVNGLSVEII